MSIIKRIKSKIAKSPVAKQDTMPSFIMTSSLRHNAEGLEAHYGETQFIERIKAAADIIDELEAALMTISMGTKDQASKRIADEALDAYYRMRR